MFALKPNEEEWYFDDNNVLYCHRTHGRQMCYLKYGIHAVYTKPTYDTDNIVKVVWHTTARHTDLPIYVLDKPLW